jgi:hypothetical protein
MRNLVVVNRDLERTTLRELVQKSEKEEQLRAIHESLLLLDERLLWNKDTLAVDLWLPDRASEPQLHDIVGRVLASDCRFQVLAELVSSLDNFPDHKIALTLRSARVREIDAAMLMQPHENA